MPKRLWPWKSQALVDWNAGPDDAAPAYVVETWQRKDIGTVERALTALLPQGASLEPLFPQADDRLDGDAFNLACFWRLRLPGPEFAVWSVSPYDLAYEIADLEGVRSVEPDLPSGLFGPGPTMFSGSGCWEPDSLCPTDRAWALRQIRAPEAWAYLHGQGLSQGKGLVIGQPDTGVADHDDLGAAVDLRLGCNLIEKCSLPMDPLAGAGLLGNPGHGTAVASVAVSRGSVLPKPAVPPGFGTGAPGAITGVSQDALVAPVRAIRSVVRVTQGRVAQAIEYCRRQGFPIISLSLGGLPLRALEAALGRAVADQRLVVCAAGNCVGLVVWPARYRTAISLGGSNEQRRPWKGSSRGPRVDVSAPAEFVWRAHREKPSDPVDRIGGGQGTSFATALTAGVAALWLNDRRDDLIAALPAGTRLQEAFRACLRATADRPPGWDLTRFGAGIVDAERLLRSGCTAAGRLVPSVTRESYAEQVLAVGAQLVSDGASAKLAALVTGIASAQDLEGADLGHESLALLTQAAWLESGGTLDAAHTYGIPLPQPSRRLRAALSR
jgi:hypothetical protein